MAEKKPKSRTSFTLSAKALELLDKLAEKHDRKKTSMLEVLIKEAAKRENVK